MKSKRNNSGYCQSVTPEYFEPPSTTGDDKKEKPLEENETRPCACGHPDVNEVHMHPIWGHTYCG
jgi:hypothetical protein